jgi:conjugal transfer pilus assembly protein TraB
MARQDDNQRKKRMTLMFGLGGLIIVIILTVIIAHFRAKPTVQKPVQAMKSTVSNSTTMAQASWIAKSSAKLQEQNKQIQELDQKMKQIQQQQEQSQTGSSQQPNNMNLKTMGLVPNNSNSSSVNYPPPPPAPTTPPPSQINKCPSNEPNCNTSYQQPPTSRQEEDLIGVAESSSSNSTSGSNKIPMVHEQKSQSQQPQQTNKKNEKASPMGFEIPPGSFVNAYLLTGADVPTSGNGEVGPIPVVFRIIGDAQMPNLYKSDIKSCFMLGQATGSLSSERAFIRIDTLSCMTKSGKSIVKSMQGYATGSDGKVGLAGTVVSKQGSMLARALVAGFLQGIGQAFQQGQQNVSISPLGQTSSIAPDTNTILRYGIGGGVSQATTKLAEFYMKMANQMFPVIVINAGRTANIIFLKEVKF